MYFYRIFAIFALISIFILTNNEISAQSYVMNSTPITTCSGTWTDPGGPNNYSNYQNITQTITATSGQLRITFNSFRTESNYDWLEIYDGSNTNAPSLGRYDGNDNPGTITATGSSLTFVFHSDGSINYEGWSATISCYDPTPTAMTLPT